MYLVTNRNLKREQGGIEIFESQLNRKGANELRLVEVTGPMNNLRAKALTDKLSTSRVQQLQAQFNLDIDPSQPYYASLEVACELFQRARKECKHLLLYVHGYNNNVKDVVQTARELEKTYPDVIVLPFTWPAKGGGAVSGTANYIDDKRDARTSEGALDRVFEIFREFHALLVEGQSAELWVRAKRKHPQNHERAREEFVRLQNRICQVSVNLLAHSMGCYVLKHATVPTNARIRKLVFDNVVLVAPDTNNHDHSSWLSAIESRNGTYVTINEDDFALQWSRRKPGEEQRARLGHYLKGLNTPSATYVDVTSASYVRDSHSYFHGQPVLKNSKLRRLFSDLFTGESPQLKSTRLRYYPEVNAYRLP